MKKITKILLASMLIAPCMAFAGCNKNTEETVKILTEEELFVKFKQVALSCVDFAGNYTIKIDNHYSDDNWGVSESGCDNVGKRAYYVKHYSSGYNPDDVFYTWSNGNRKYEGTSVTSVSYVPNTLPDFNIADKLHLSSLSDDNIKNLLNNVSDINEYAKILLKDDYTMLNDTTYYTEKSSLITGKFEIIDNNYVFTVYMTKTIISRDTNEEEIYKLTYRYIFNNQYVLNCYITMDDISLQNFNYRAFNYKHCQVLYNIFNDSVFPANFS